MRALESLLRMSVILVALVSCASPRPEVPQQAPTPVTSSDAEVQRLKAEASVLGRQRNFAQAIVKLERAVSLNPDDAEARRLLGYQTSIDSKEGIARMIEWAKDLGAQQPRYMEEGLELTTDETPVTWTQRLI